MLWMPKKHVGQKRRLDQEEAEASEEEENSDTEEVAKIEMHRLAEKEDAHMYVEYKRGDQMQVDEREDTCGKSTT